MKESHLQIGRLGGERDKVHEKNSIPKTKGEVAGTELDEEGEQLWLGLACNVNPRPGRGVKGIRNVF